MIDVDSLVLEKEDISFLELRGRFINELKKSSFSKELFVEICHWKSHRNAKHPLKNSQEKITRVMSCVFKHGVVQPRAIEKLSQLSGVRVPTASVFLTLYDPDKYGIVDYHAWQSLHVRGLLHYNRTGKGLKPRDYNNYLNSIRLLAVEYNISPRIIDISLMAENQRRNPNHKSLCWLGT
ncbi:hypothetical protein DBT82_RS23665 [Vibrio parahaemolyticus]|uniref:hypothetical protein n=1 Tax=Vibrio parahaemolyticus TaxID=670 RepID=UPI0004D72116|nr:hypothetical protein [Vibrio parahaemolyticus]EGQ7878260.1 hypothetical protein [Vibrio parahaemolyticus]EGR0229264.1 hypothetical protein [Vibrio parahaemolyticus]EGR1176469.1 hypothetical protein [Vibrio parahaemolyticus]EGR1364111.1 hypothetical protein [Vibrio parahaemolyticus]EGR9060753.1 hypothetical protein [Vibrio parahaemolyticus]